MKQYSTWQRSAILYSYGIEHANHVAFGLQCRYTDVRMQTWMWAHKAKQTRLLVAIDNARSHTTYPPKVIMFLDD